MLPRLTGVPTEVRLGAEQVVQARIFRALFAAGLLEPVAPRPKDSLTALIAAALHRTVRARMPSASPGRAEVAIQRVDDCAPCDGGLWLTLTWTEPDGLCLEPLERALLDLDGRYQAERDRGRFERALFNEPPVLEPQPSLALSVLPTLVHRLDRALCAVAPIFGPQDALGLVEAWSWEGEASGEAVYVEAREQLEEARGREGDARPVTNEEVEAYADQNLLTPRVVRERLGSQHTDFAPLEAEALDRALDVWIARPDDARFEALGRLRRLSAIIRELEALTPSLNAAETRARGRHEDPFDAEYGYAFVLGARLERDLVTEMFDEAMDLAMQVGSFHPTWAVPLDGTPESLEAVGVFFEVAPRVFSLAAEAMEALRWPVETTP